MDTGGAIGIYNITRALARRGHQITFVCFGADNSVDCPLDDFCDPHIVQHDTRTRTGALLTNLLSPLPYTISKYRSEAMREALRGLCGSRKFDVVHVDHIHMAPYGAMVKEEFGLPLVIREHNFETTIYERFASRQRRPILRRYMNMQAKRLLLFEAAQLRQADIIAAITGEDAARISSLVSRPVMVVPAGVDLDLHPVLDRTQEDGASVTLLGSLAWEPNLDGVEWFVDSIWPRIASAESTARLILAGASPPPGIRTLAGPGIEVPGFVPDLNRLLARSTVLAVPLRIGGGMRIKLLEYFAHGKAVVSTRIGAEGNVARHGEHLLLADDSSSFADAVLTLLRDADERKRLGVKARELVEQRYSWEAIGEQFEHCYHRAVALAGT